MHINAEERIEKPEIHLPYFIRFSNNPFVAILVVGECLARASASLNFPMISYQIRSEVNIKLKHSTINLHRKANKILMLCK